MFIKCMISILSLYTVSPIFTLSIVVIISHTVEVPAMLKEGFETEFHKIINLLKPHQIGNLDCPSTEHIHCSDSSLVCGLHAGNLRLKFNSRDYNSIKSYFQHHRMGLICWHSDLAECNLWSDQSRRWTGCQDTECGRMICIDCCCDRNYTAKIESMNSWFIRNRNLLVFRRIMQYKYELQEWDRRVSEYF